MRVVGIGGTSRENSSTEWALRVCLTNIEKLGAETVVFGAAELDLPMFAPEEPQVTERARKLIEAVREADGIVIASPGYHGAMSGLVKNALDYLELLRDDPRPYLEGRAVGCIVCAYGWQATVTTLVSLRSIVHALRGWPTPLGIALNTAEPVWSEDGLVVEEPVGSQMRILASQVVTFAEMSRAFADASSQSG